MRISSFFELRDGEFEVADVKIAGFVFQCLDFQRFIFIYYGYLPVVEIGEIVGIVDDGRSI